LLGNHLKKTAEAANPATLKNRTLVESVAAAAILDRGWHPRAKTPALELR
jgi:hypothetical protein